MAGSHSARPAPVSGSLRERLAVALFAVQDELLFHRRRPDPEAEWAAVKASTAASSTAFVDGIYARADAALEVVSAAVAEVDVAALLAGGEVLAHDGVPDPGARAVMRHLTAMLRPQPVKD